MKTRRGILEREGAIQGGRGIATNSIALLPYSATSWDYGPEATNAMTPPMSEMQEPLPGWADVPAILARIRPPEFPARDFNILDQGVRSDGSEDSLPAIQAAIEACAAAGGGRVLVPPGEYLLNGPVHLRSRVNLHVSEGATLRFSGEPAHFLPAVLTRWEGTILYNYSPLIYARDEENIAITGGGVIDGNARRVFSSWGVGDPKPQKAAQERSRQLGADGTAFGLRRFGEGSYLRPAAIQPFECRNVLIEGITVRDAPFWVIHPVFCANVTVRRVTVDSRYVNNDGCDPDSCTDVLIEDCVFLTGDDGIAIKAGRGADAWSDGRATENLIIRNCVFRSDINALCVGSEMSAGVRNVFMEDCRVDAGESCVYFKSNADRGGFIANVHVRRVHIAESRAAVVRFETNYHGYRGGNAPSVYRDFVLEDITCEAASHYGIYAEGTSESPVERVILRNVSIHQALEPVFLRHVSALRLENVRVNGVVLPVTPQETPGNTPKLGIRL